MQGKSHIMSVLRSRKVVWYMQDVCAVHIWRNSVRDRPKLLVFKQLGSNDEGLVLQLKLGNLKQTKTLQPHISGTAKCTV